MPEFPYGLDEAGYDRYLDAAHGGGDCPATFEAVEEQMPGGCPLCGQMPEAHRRES